MDSDNEVVDFYQEWATSLYHKDGKPVKTLVIGGHVYTNAEAYVVRDGFFVENAYRQKLPIRYNTGLKTWVLVN